MMLVLVCEWILVIYLLQLFDWKNVIFGVLLGVKLFMFDFVVFVVVQVVVGKCCLLMVFIFGWLFVLFVVDVMLVDLFDFFKDLVKGFFWVLDYMLFWDVDIVEDLILVQVDVLVEWMVGEWMLCDMFCGLYFDDVVYFEWCCGMLLFGCFGV